MIKDLTGRTFGKLTVLEYAGYNEKGHSSLWKCKCECGNIKIISGIHLTSGNTKSCGCLHHKSNAYDLTNKRNNKLVAIKKVGIDKTGKALWLCKCDCGNEIIRTCDIFLNGSGHCGCVKHSNAKTHGLGKTRLYKIWTGIKQRCFNKKNPAYKNYGGRGITICDEWLNVESFYNWAINNGYNDYLSIDRVNNNGDYEPSNCRWATMSEQNLNTRRSLKIKFNGIEYTSHELAELLNISVSTLYHHKSRGTLNNYLNTKEA